MNKKTILPILLALVLAGCGGENSSASTSESASDSSSNSGTSDSGSGTSGSSSDSSTGDSSTGDSSDTSSEEENPVPTSMTTDFSRSVLAVNETVEVNLTFSPSNANPRVSFRSSDPSVISCDSDNRTLTGVSAGKNAVTVIITCLDNTAIPAITLTLSVSQDEDEVNKDKAMDTFYEAMNNESAKVKSGHIAFSYTYSNGTTVNFANDYDTYSDHSYNSITDFDGDSFIEYRSRYGERYYEVSYDAEGNYTNSHTYGIIGDDETDYFSTSVTESVASRRVSLPALYTSPFSTSYTYGVSGFLDSEFVDDVLDNDYSLAVEGDKMTITYANVTYYDSDVYTLEATFQDGAFKEVNYVLASYDLDDVGEDGLPTSEEAVPTTKVTFEASMTLGDKTVDNREDKILPEDLFFDSFSLNFYRSTDTDRATPLTSFTRGDTIVFTPSDFAPSTALDGIDRIEAISSSNEEVISVSANKLALSAIGEGSAEITFESEKYTYKATLSVTIAAATGVYISSLPSSMLNTDSTRFYIQAEPFGALNDFDVTLKDDGSSNYASLSYNAATDYYTLTGNSEMTEKEGVATIVVQSRSNPSIKEEVAVTIMKQLTSAEMFAVLTSAEYVSEINTSYYNYYVKATFGSTLESSGYPGTYEIYRESGTLWATFTFHYTINSGKINVVDSSSSLDILSKLSITIDSPNGKELYTTFVEANDEYGDETVTFYLNQVEASENA